MPRHSDCALDSSHGSGFLLFPYWCRYSYCFRFEYSKDAFMPSSYDLFSLYSKMIAHCSLRFELEVFMPITSASTLPGWIEPLQQFWKGSTSPVLSIKSFYYPLKYLCLGLHQMGNIRRLFIPAESSCYGSDTTWRLPELASGRVAQISWFMQLRRPETASFPASRCTVRLREPGDRQDGRWSAHKFEDSQEMSFGVY